MNKAHKGDNLKPLKSMAIVPLTSLGGELCLHVLVSILSRKKIAHSLFRYCISIRIKSGIHSELDTSES